MENDLFKSVLSVAGIGGAALLALVLIFRDIIRKNIFPMLTKSQATIILILIVVFTSILVGLGIGAWVYANSRENKSVPSGPTPTATGAKGLTTATPLITPTVDVKTTPTATPTPTPTPNASLPGRFSVSGRQRTKICVKAGDKLLVTAGGQISFGPNIRTAGPDGKNTLILPLIGEQYIDAQYYKYDNFPFGALLCRLDSESDWRLCGSQNIFIASAPGCLEFEVNDSYLRDNRGAFNVYVDSVR